ncbi:hypothetical protein [Phytoactinopolyspora endophytica]|uniref:hypothetical protein n=1 Tax=Phytoactinopolyspora endophytica TaxID=1642495 RepID=UPI00197C6858|nr:hypothetical protein [Phytoactinopolyspora endophytica]
MITVAFLAGAAVVGTVLWYLVDRNRDRISTMMAVLAAAAPLVLLGIATLLALGHSETGSWTLRTGHAVAVVAAVPGGLVVTAVLRLADRSPLARGTSPAQGWTAGAPDRTGNVSPSVPPPPPPPPLTSSFSGPSASMPGMPPVFTSSPPAEPAAATPHAADVQTFSNPDTLRGGATIGVLERAAFIIAMLAGWPEGLALILALKGLGRYPELRRPSAPERFIIGTFASILWAAAVAGVVVALRA